MKQADQPEMRSIERPAWIVTLSLVVVLTVLGSGVYVLGFYLK
jgi:hypothetical protein